MFYPVKENITIFQGATFCRTWKIIVGVSSINFSGWSGKCQVRTIYGSRKVIFECTSADEEIILDSDNSRLTLYIPPEKTALLSQNAVYDIELTDPVGDVGRVVMGSVRLSPEVTK